MKKIIITFLVIIVAIVLVIFLGKGALSMLKNTETPTTSQKVGTTTKTGVISSSNNVFYLQEAGQTPKEINSYTVELSKYVGKSVTVSGQYSGDTLFVGSVETK